MAVSEPQPRDLLPPGEAYSLVTRLGLHISRGTFRRWARRGVVPSVQASRGYQRWFDPADLERLVRKMRT